jgi:hypothetical protein
LDLLLLLLELCLLPLELLLLLLETLLHEGLVPMIVAFRVAVDRVCLLVLLVLLLLGLLRS